MTGPKKQEDGSEVWAKAYETMQSATKGQYGVALFYSDADEIREAIKSVAILRRDS